MAHDHRMLWADVYRELRAAKPGETVTLPKGAIASPLAAGAEASRGLGLGAHYRFAPDARCRGLHVREEDGSYEAHLDRVHPSCSLVGHLRADAPGVFVVGGVAAGAAAGAFIGGGRGAAIGGALGCVASMLLVR